MKSKILWTKIPIGLISLRFDMEMHFSEITQNCWMLNYLLLLLFVTSRPLPSKKQDQPKFKKVFKFILFLFLQNFFPPYRRDFMLTSFTSPNKLYLTREKNLFYYFLIRFFTWKRNHCLHVESSTYLFFLLTQYQLNPVCIQQLLDYIQQQKSTFCSILKWKPDQHTCIERQWGLDRWEGSAM